MRTASRDAIYVLGAIIVVLIVAVTYLASVDKAGVPEAAVFGTSISLGLGALVTLLARSQGDATAVATTQAIVPPLAASSPPAVPVLDEEKLAEMIAAAVVRAEARRAA